MLGILIAILTFGFLIFIHELGHFLTAKKCGVGILEFSIGMGPKLLSRRGKDGTVYSLRLLPIGGFVNMYGEDTDLSEEQQAISEAEREKVGLPRFPPEAAFSAQKTWKKILITAMGAVVNLLFGFLLMVILTATQSGLHGTTIVAQVFPAENVESVDELQVGDEILSVNGHNVHIMYDLFYRLMLEDTQEMEIVVLRNGQKQTLHITFPKSAEDPNFSEINFNVYGVKRSFTVVMKQAYYRCVSTVTTVLESLKGLLTGRFGMESMSGPVGITEELGTAASHGPDSFFLLVVMISVNLGVFNLLPIPALDGGRLLFLLIELIRRKPLNPKYEGYVHAIGFLLLMCLFVFITCQDIGRLIG